MSLARPFVDRINLILNIVESHRIENERKCIVNGRPGIGRIENGIAILEVRFK
jgi:hypothetical protein